MITRGRRTPRRLLLEAVAPSRSGSARAAASTRSMIASQASMHWVQATHSICRPLRMSIPVGQVMTQALQSMQSPYVLARRVRLLRPPARLAARGVVADDQRAAVEQHRLEPPVGAGDQAGLLAEPGEVEEHQERRRRHHQERGRVLDRRLPDPAARAPRPRRSRRGRCGPGPSRARGRRPTSGRGAGSAPRGRAVSAGRGPPRTGARSAGRGTPCRPSAGRPSRTRRARRSRSGGRSG